MLDEKGRECTFCSRQMTWYQGVKRGFRDVGTPKSLFRIFLDSGILVPRRTAGTEARRPMRPKNI
jgi:hypothetical protein